MNSALVFMNEFVDCYQLSVVSIYEVPLLELPLQIYVIP